PGALARAAASLAQAPLELEALDVGWERGGGVILARFGGLTAGEQAEAAGTARMREEGLETQVASDDEELWERQRAGQRSRDGVVVRVSALPSRLEAVLDTAARLDAGVVGRAGTGVSWLRLPPLPAADAVAAVERVRRELAPSPCVVLDAPVEVRERLDVWGVTDESLLRLTRRVKERFDPRSICNPGIFVGGL
ncbi:MAG: hypothetical protein M3312_11315, partial [Actinomycetota bacterium]|nr:hypothetical protein [Actinomycetota bacterium]